MATRPDKVKILSGDGNTLCWEWSLAPGEVGEPVAVPIQSDKSVHIYGTLDGGGSIDIEGTLETESPANYAPLKDQQGNLTSSIVAANLPFLEAIVPHTVLVRAKRSAGGTGETKVRLLAVA